MFGVQFFYFFLIQKTKSKIVIIDTLKIVFYVSHKYIFLSNIICLECTMRFLDVNNITQIRKEEEEGKCRVMTPLKQALTKLHQVLPMTKLEEATQTTCRTMLQPNINSMTIILQLNINVILTYKYVNSDIILSISTKYG